MDSYTVTDLMMPAAVLAFLVLLMVAATYALLLVTMEWLIPALAVRRLTWRLQVHERIQEQAQSGAAARHRPDRAPLHCIAGPNVPPLRD